MRSRTGTCNGPAGRGAARIRRVSGRRYLQQKVKRIPGKAHDVATSVSHVSRLPVFSVSQVIGTRVEKPEGHAVAPFLTTQKSPE